MLSRIRVPCQISFPVLPIFATRVLARQTQTLKLESINERYGYLRHATTKSTSGMGNLVSKGGVHDTTSLGSRYKIVQLDSDQELPQGNNSSNKLARPGEQQEQQLETAQKEKSIIESKKRKRSMEDNDQNILEAVEEAVTQADQGLSQLFRVTIDGSVGEGGGQVLRNAVAYSAMLGVPLHIHNIRAGRPVPGLRQQHLHGVHLVAELNGGKLHDDVVVGSTELSFTPQKLLALDRASRGGEFKVECGTAASMTLMIQASVLPALIKAYHGAENGSTETILHLSGGSDVPQSPSFDYMKYVLVPALKPFGVDLDLKILKRGAYPRGQGRIDVRVKKCAESFAASKIKAYHEHSLIPIDWRKQGKLVQVFGRAFSAPSNPSFATDVFHGAKRVLRNARLSSISELPELEFECQTLKVGEYVDSCDGALLGCRFDNGVILGVDKPIEMKKKPEKKNRGHNKGKDGRHSQHLDQPDGKSVGEELANRLLAIVESGATVDEHLSDMLVPFMMIAHGSSCVRLMGPPSSHLQTSVDIAKMFGGHFELSQVPESPSLWELRSDGLSTPVL